MIPDKTSLEKVSPTAVVESNLEWALGDDLVQVRARLQTCIQSGYPLVDDLLAERIHSHYPRAIIVLGTSRLGSTDQHSRVALAAAIEMLHLAVDVHDAIPRGELVIDERMRMWLGASILVGDYCFSQASMLAAETGNPAVVSAFSNALSKVSEQRVVTLLERPQHPHTDDAILYASAAEAAALLVGLPRPIRYALSEAAAAFGEMLTDSETSLAEAIAHLDALTRDRPRAQPLVNWLRRRSPV
jgi:octaprenyl-diphosphate synthase